MNDQFNICNFWKPISLNQYKSIGKRLEESLKQINPQIKSELVLTIDLSDYLLINSKTTMNDEIVHALNKKQRYRLDELDENLWESSYERSLFFIEENKNNIISMSNDIGKSKLLKFWYIKPDIKYDDVINKFRNIGGI